MVHGLVHIMMETLHIGQMNIMQQINMSLSLSWEVE
uniref:Uncharacterized protein n=1 Tax=Myoviridae sp. ctCo31 TaxID=2825053 RepID=A0A8S5UMF7_9CAUD|nr:MAG TPA: hypothetical protein [Myoviridae sp. ctCo31]